MRDQGLEAIVTESHIRYRTPARFDDRLTIHARCVDVRGARFRYEYVVERADGARVAEGWTGHAVVNANTFAPTRVPAWLAEAIATAESEG
jgi:acyl-CoA thioester hydrolase